MNSWKLISSKWYGEVEVELYVNDICDYLLEIESTRIHISLPYSTCKISNNRRAKGLLLNWGKYTAIDLRVIGQFDIMPVINRETNELVDSSVINDYTLEKVSVIGKELALSYLTEKGTVHTVFATVNGVTGYYRILDDCEPLNQNSKNFLVADGSVVLELDKVYKIYTTEEELIVDSGAIGLHSTGNREPLFLRNLIDEDMMETMLSTCKGKLYYQVSSVDLSRIEHSQKIWRGIELRNNIGQSISYLLKQNCEYFRDGDTLTIKCNEDNELAINVRDIYAIYTDYIKFVKSDKNYVLSIKEKLSDLELKNRYFRCMDTIQEDEPVSFIKVTEKGTAKLYYEGSTDSIIIKMAGIDIIYNHMLGMQHTCMDPVIGVNAEIKHGIFRVQIVAGEKEIKVAVNLKAKAFVPEFEDDDLDDGKMYAITYKDVYLPKDVCGFIKDYCVELRSGTSTTLDRLVSLREELIKRLQSDMDNALLSDNDLEKLTMLIEDLRRFNSISQDAYGPYLRVQRLPFVISIKAEQVNPGQIMTKCELDSVTYGKISRDIEFYYKRELTVGALKHYENSQKTRLKMINERNK